MRTEKFGVNSIVHGIQRGNQGLRFLESSSDVQRHMLCLKHKNDSFSSSTWFRDVQQEGVVESFARPEKWPHQHKIITLHCFCDHYNHFHTIMQEINEGGVALYMKSVNHSTSMSWKAKDPTKKSRGTIYQGPYVAKIIDEDFYLRYVFAYILVKNTFEMHPHGYDFASTHFNEAFDWARKCPRSSLFDFMGPFDRGIADGALFKALFPSDSFKKFAKDVIDGRAHLIPKNRLE